MKSLLIILICTLASVVSAVEPWMYPVDISSSPTIADISSLTMKSSYTADTNGFRPFEGTTRVVDADVATFREIVKWYADKAGETRLPKTLDRYVTDGKSGPGIGFFKTAQSSLSTHLAFRFLPDQKHITLLHAENNGDVVAISLLGLNHETSIQVIRHYRNPKAIAQKNEESTQAGLTDSSK